MLVFCSVVILSFYLLQILRQNSHFADLYCMGFPAPLPSTPPHSSPLPSTPLPSLSPLPSPPLPFSALCFIHHLHFLTATHHSFSQSLKLDILLLLAHSLDPARTRFPKAIFPVYSSIDYILLLCRFVMCVNPNPNANPISNSNLML